VQREVIHAVVAPLITVASLPPLRPLCPGCRHELGGRRGRCYGPIIDAGGSVGRMHRRCFIAWDRRQEAREALSLEALAPFFDDTELAPVPAPARRVA
jgi:hypothetical protein